MRLGSVDIPISRLGMGCWAIGGHGWGEVNDADSIQAIRYALEHGVTLFDTADAYGLGKSESLLASVLGPSRHKVVIASKGGVRWDETGKVWNDSSPSYLRLALENSLRRLKLDCIPLYYIHKPDGVTPIQDSVAVLERMREEGKIVAIGVSNFTVDQLREALKTAPVSAVQVRCNIFDRVAFNACLDICRKHAIAIVAWGALADGLLTGKFTKNTTFSDDDHRSRLSEFIGDAYIKNLRSVAWLKTLPVSRKYGVSQLALRWVLDYSKMTCALFGAKTDHQVRQNLGADGWHLTLSEMLLIDVGLLGRQDSNLGMRDPNSRDLPLVDAPI